MRLTRRVQHDRNMISARVRRHVEQAFAASDAERVLDELRTVELPMDGGTVSERLQAALVLLAGGNGDTFAAAVDLAKVDGRDLLVAAELAHANWPSELDRRLGEGR